MTFGELKIGDIFTVEEDYNVVEDDEVIECSTDVKYIKIELVEMVKYGKDYYYNSVCIDENSENKGLLGYFEDNESVSHVNWS